MRRPFPGAIVALALLACAGVAGLGAVRSADGPVAPPGARATAAARTDLHGDPLPAGARARLGTVRWRHGAGVNYLAFTPDGKAVLTASADEVIRLWDRKSGKEIRRFGTKPAVAVPPRPDGLAVGPGGWGGVGTGVRSVALSPDGKMVVANGPNNTLHRWDVATGKELRGMAAMGASSLVFSDNGKVFVGRVPAGATIVWDAKTGKEIRQLQRPQDPRNGMVFIGGTLGVAVSPDGKTVAMPETLFANQKVVTQVSLWDVDTGKELRLVEEGMGMATTALAFAPDGKALACAVGNRVTLWAPQTGKEIRRLNTANQVTTLVFSPDGKTLATKGVWEGVTRLYSAETGKLLREFANARGANQGVFGYFGAVTRDVAFAPDGKVVALAAGNTIRFWDAGSGKEVTTTGGHRGEITSLTVAPGGKLVASRGADNTVRLWETDTGKQRQEFPARNGTTCAAFAPDARTVALGQNDGTVGLYEVATGKELRRLQRQPNGVAAVAFAPDGKVLAARDSMGATLRLYEAATGKELRVIGSAPPKNVGGVVQVMTVQGATSRVGVAFSPDGKRVLAPKMTAANPLVMGPGGVGGMHTTVAVWDVDTGKEVQQINLPVQFALMNFVLAPDGRTLATEGADRTITVWELASGRERARLGKVAGQSAPAVPQQVVIRGGVANFGIVMGPAATPTLAFAPDGRTLACPGPDRAVRLWDIAAGKEIGLLKGHEGDITALAFTPDGKALISGSADTTMLVWDMTRLRPAARPRAATLKAAEVKALWADLAGADGIKAFRGMQTLGSAPGQTVAFLGARLRPAAPPDAEKLRQWIVDLESKRFAARQRASSALEKLGELAVPALQKALRDGPPLETRRRLEQLLDKLTASALSNEQLRLVRAVEVLEEVGTPEARQILEALGRGAPGALPTREARAALDRLARRAP